MRMDSDPSAAARLLDVAAQRIDAAANVHRRLNDPSLFRQGLHPILKGAVSSILDIERVDLIVEIDEVALSFDQMSMITMLVIELANNAQKHVFRKGLGTRFTMKLQRIAADRAALTVWDDGPGAFQTADADIVDDGLGLGIVRDLVAQLRGRLSLTPGRGTEFIVEFPVGQHQLGRDVC